MKVCVIGAGAIGGLFAAHLATVADVFVLTRRQEQAQVLNDRGLQVSGRHDFTARVTATADPGELPDFDLARARLPDVLGKAVVYARREVTPEDTHHWLADRDLGDVPPSGERIARGRPICTIFARGRTVARCDAALARRAHALYRALEARRVRIA